MSKRYRAMGAREHAAARAVGAAFLCAGLMLAGCGNHEKAAPQSAGTSAAQAGKPGALATTALAPPASPEASALAAMQRVPLPATVDFGRPVEYARENIGHTSDTPERRRLEDALDRLVFQVGDPWHDTPKSFQPLLRVFRVGGASTMAETAQLIETLRAPAEVKAAASAVVAVLFADGDRADALAALIKAKNLTSQMFINEAVSALLLAPNRGISYPDLAMAFYDKQVGAYVIVGMAPARESQELLRTHLELGVTIAGLRANFPDIDRTHFVYAIHARPAADALAEPLGWHLRGAIADSWRRLEEAVPGAEAKGEFETSAQFQARVDGQQQAAAATMGSQVNFARQMLSLAEGDEWVVDALAYNADQQSFKGLLKHAASSSTIPFSMAVDVAQARAVKEDFAGRVVSLVYRVDTGKTLTVDRVFIHGARFFSLAVTNWDTTIPLAKAESDKFVALRLAVEKQDREQAKVRDAKRAAAAAAQDHRAGPASEQGTEQRAAMQALELKCLAIISEKLAVSSTTPAQAKAQFQRQAQAIQECQTIGRGEAVPPDGVLAALVNQEDAENLVKSLRASARPFCGTIADQVTVVVNAGGNDQQIETLRRTAQQNGCLR